jgi:hypothetical protein
MMTPARYRELRADLSDYTLEIAERLKIDRSEAWELAIEELAEIVNGGPLRIPACRIATRWKLERYVEEEEQVRSDPTEPPGDLAHSPPATIRAEVLRSMMSVLVDVILNDTTGASAL